MTASTCPSCSYALGSNWRHCERCREGMAPQPTAAELVETATARVIASQLATIDELRCEIARLRELVGR